MLAAADSLVQDTSIHLAIAAPSLLVDRMELICGEKISYYVFPLGRGNTHINKEYEQYWNAIVSTFHPDVVHIHGTEFSHGLAYVNACGAKNVVVSIQGLTSAFEFYYYGLSISEIRKNVTPRDIIKGNTLRAYRRFKARSIYEKQLLTRVQHVIGRTSWDRARVWAVNPSIDYHFCNETLREEFYTGQWDYEKCQKHSIFFSQANYPLKGLHMLLRALPLVIRHFPDLTVRIAGSDITRSSSLFERLKITDYGRIIRRLIRNNNLQERVVFTGPLDAEQMKREYLNANVFICSSSIENSPNSLCEAQLLGVPVIASYVGGVPDLMKGDEIHLYRFEEIEMLAWRICDLFENSNNINYSNLRQIALERHDSRINLTTLVDIYNTIINDQ